MKKSRIVSLALAGAVTTAVLFAGTYAWRSVTQDATNQVLGSLNPGGRLHDDFNGMRANANDTNVKNVYVENFTEEGAKIYARIRFDEYLEKGEGAGKLKADGQKADENKAVSIVSTASIDNESTWTTYKWDANSEFRKYVSLNTGGKTIYLPTYNRDKDSLEAEVNGELRIGADGKATYPDYKPYTLNETENGVEIYALDNLNIDEVNKAGITAQEIIDAIMDTAAGTVHSTITAATTQLTIGSYTDAKVRVVVDESSDVTEVYLDLWDAQNITKAADGIEDIKVVVPTQMHQAKDTLETAEVISIAQWMSADTGNGGKNKQPGEYWVYDTDGWVYWAEPIVSQTATGCLINSIQMVDGANIDGEFYYALNVVSQFATAGDWNTDVEGAGFKQGDITENAVDLLNTISAPTAVTPGP